jgi:hypothetical protein
MTPNAINPAKTPGIAHAGLSKATICNSKWGEDARHVTRAMKDQVFALYGYSGYNDARCASNPGVSLPQRG